jgi:hypothetical protein
MSVVRVWLGAPLAAVLAAPFWFTPLLRVDQPIEVGAYVVVSMALATCGLFGPEVLERFAPRARVAAGLAAIAIGAVEYTLYAPFRGPATDLIAIVWLFTALSAYLVVKKPLRLSERWSGPRRAGVSIAICVAALVVYSGSKPWLDHHPAGMAVLLAVGVAGLALMPRRHLSGE